MCPRLLFNVQHSEDSTSLRANSELSLLDLIIINNASMVENIFSVIQVLGRAVIFYYFSILIVAQKSTWQKKQQKTITFL